MEESGPHKQSILRNKEVSLKNAPRKPRDVTRPTVMVKRLGFRGTLPVKYKIDFWNNPITASILVWNQVVLNQSQQLGYLNSKLMLSWDCPFKHNFYTENDSPGREKRKSAQKSTVDRLVFHWPPHFGWRSCFKSPICGHRDIGSRVSGYLQGGNKLREHRLLACLERKNQR